MDENIRISKEEREQLVRGETAEFPRYTSQLLNLANQNAQSTRRKVVGDMKKILDEFQQEYPNGTYEDWKEFYLEEKDGEERLEKSAGKLFEMIVLMKEAMEKIDEEMAYDYVTDLVLYKTFMGEEAKEAILKKLADVFNCDYQIATSHETVDGFLNGQPILIASFDEKSQAKKRAKLHDIPIVYYNMNKHDNSIEVDTYQLSRELGVVVTDEEVHASLDSFN